MRCSLFRKIHQVSEKHGVEFSWIADSGANVITLSNFVMGTKDQVPIRNCESVTGTMYHTHVTQDGIYFYPPSVEDVFMLFYNSTSIPKANSKTNHSNPKFTESIIIAPCFIYSIKMTISSYKILDNLMKLSVNKIQDWKTKTTKLVQKNLNKVHRGLMSVQSYLDFLIEVFQIDIITIDWDDVNVNT